MKKIFNLLMSVMLLSVLMGCSTNTVPGDESSSEPKEGEITLNIKIIDETAEAGIVLFDDQVVVNAACETLADVLVEAVELQAITSESEYGLTLESLMDISTDWQKGPWWVYESDNNDSCIALGMCDSINKTPIEDKDNFIFMFTSEF